MFKKLLILTTLLFLPLSGQAGNSLTGEYTLDVKIGESKFTDILIITSAEFTPMPIAHSVLIGTMESLGLFKVPFKGQFFPSSSKFVGEFTIDEGRGPQKIILKSTIGHFMTIEGTLSLDGESFGTFEGLKTGDLP